MRHSIIVEARHTTDSWEISTSCPDNLSWARAASQVFLDGNPTGFQVADFRHSVSAAIERLICEECGYGMDDLQTRYIVQLDEREDTALCDLVLALEGIAAKNDARQEWAESTRETLVEAAESGPWHDCEPVIGSVNTLVGMSMDMSVAGDKIDGYKARTIRRLARIIESRSV